MKPKISNMIFISFMVIANLILIYILYHFIDDYFGSEIMKREKDGFEDAKIFVQNGYPEIKALATQLLTLLTSILVFSITFSEKIINFQTASPTAKFPMFVSWCFMLLAIISAGLGIAFNSFTLPFALRDQVDSINEPNQSIEFYQIASKALFFISASGQFFISGLLSMIIAGIKGYKKP